MTQNQETLSTKEHTEAHGDKVGGYKKLTDEQIEAINQLKTLENKIGDIVEHMASEPSMIDARWLAIGRTDLQKGFMALVRSIAQPESKL